MEREKDDCEEPSDPGVPDKRLIVSEPEFAGGSRLWSGTATRCRLSSGRRGRVESSRPSPKLAAGVRPALTFRSLLTLPKMKYARV